VLASGINPCVRQSRCALTKAGTGAADGILSFHARVEIRIRGVPGEHGTFFTHTGGLSRMESDQ
jgi:hypothetical protein